MNTNNPELVVPAVLAGLLGGAILALVDNKATGRLKEEKPSIIERLKQAEHKFYLDGMERADQIEEIKREVDQAVTL
ncbi:hypothetical protein [Oceanobacillus chungangensis]|uniref:Uncharacterized protein n=1 Tax=Oceanobacillus chungangensis TaxID=1229152 RepID=A0A3D8PUK8_9BACI|nr:hypothetical protein [Oceanobacillus chungangensis]RDW18625.1 hypothetical protein CWR45_09925 [Oceanobacillus chungangensis]